MEGETRLTWRKSEHGDYLFAKAGGLELIASKAYGGGFGWWVTGSVDTPIADTLLAAQLAAEAAALTLLCDAVASFGVESPAAVIHFASASGMWMTGCEPQVYAKAYPADARRLACALLAAARVKP